MYIYIYIYIYIYSLKRNNTENEAQPNNELSSEICLI